MDQEYNFESVPFEFATEYGGEQAEEEAEWRRRAFPGRRPRPSFRPRPPLSGPRRPYPRLRRPRPIGFWPRRPWGVVEEPFPVESQPPDASAGSERIRWIQDCLNQAMGLQLPVTGIMGPETRSAVRSFQRRQGLRASGIVGPDTEGALQKACSGQNDQQALPTEDIGEVSGGELFSRSSQADMELPAQFRLNFDTLLHLMQADQRARWDRMSRCYPLSEWERAPEAAGVYLLVFRNPDARSRIGYVGETDNLRRRMRGYYRDLNAFGVSHGNYAFCYFENRNRIPMERRLRRVLRPTGRVTNQREFEIGSEL